MNYPQGVLFIFLLIRVLQIGAECPGGIPVFGSLSQAIPSLRNMPGMNFIPNNKGIGLVNMPGVSENKNLDSAIEQVLIFLHVHMGLYQKSDSIFKVWI